MTMLAINWGNTWLITGVGFAMVFVVLVLLIFIVKSFGVIFAQKPAKAQPAAAAAAAGEEKKEEPKQRVQAQVISDETRKVLEAAVSQITGGKGRITDIKKV